jgi:hypothetical protein
MSWATISTQVYNLINTNKVSLGIREVYSFPKYNFGGYPSCNVTPSENESDYETTTENTRSYIFIVRIFDETKNQGIDQALSNLRTVADALIDKVDEEDKKPGSTRTIGVSLPAGYVYIDVWATPGTWGQVDNENLVFCEVKVKVRISVDVS